MTKQHTDNRWHPAHDRWNWARHHGLWDDDDVAGLALALAVAEAAEEPDSWVTPEHLDQIRSALATTAPFNAQLLEALAGARSRLADLAQDAPRLARVLIAARPDLPDEVAGRMFFDDDSDVLTALVLNPAVDEDLVNGIVWLRDDEGTLETVYDLRRGRQTVGRSSAEVELSQTPSTPATDEYDPDYRGRLSIEQTRAGTAALHWRPDQRPEDTVDEDLVADLVRRTDDSGLLGRTFLRGHGNYRVAAAGNQSLPRELLAQACVDPSPEVRMAALGNLSLTGDLARIALAEAAERHGRDTEDEEADHILLALARNRGLPADILVSLAGRGLAAAAVTLLAHHPADAWAPLDADALVDVAFADPADPVLRSVPVGRLPWRARLAMLDLELCDPDELLELVADDAEAGWDFEAVADAFLRVHRSSGWWFPNSPGHHLPALLAGDERCCPELAAHLLGEHRDRTSAMHALAGTEQLDRDLRPGAMYDWTDLDNAVGDLLQAERACSLGRALLQRSRSPEELTRLAGLLDAGDDAVLGRLGYATAGQLVAEAAARVAHPR